MDMPQGGKTRSGGPPGEDQYSDGNSSVVTLGDDPKLQVRLDLVGRKQAVLAGAQGTVIGLPVAVVEIAPVGAEMAREISAGIEAALLDQFIDAGGHDQLPGQESRLRDNANEMCFMCHGGDSIRNEGPWHPIGVNGPGGWMMQATEGRLLGCRGGGSTHWRVRIRTAA